MPDCVSCRETSSAPSRSAPRFPGTMPCSRHSASAPSARRHCCRTPRGKSLARCRSTACGGSFGSRRSASVRRGDSWVPSTIGLLIPLLLRHAFADKERQEAIIRATSLEWTIVQPAALTNGPRTGTYRVGACAGRFFPTVSRADVAHFMIEELENPRHVRQVVLFAIDVDRRHARIPVGPRDRLEPLGIKADGRQRGGGRGLAELGALGAASF